MAYQFHFVYLFAFFISLHAEWVEITQKRTQSIVNKPKSSIRILKKSEVENLFNIEKTTPSPQWIAYQKERFGNLRNSDSHKLVVTTENQMKNSASVVVPANNGNNLIQKRPKNQIIRTTTRVDVIDNQPIEAMIELPHLEPQTTTRREMNHGHVDANDYEYTENVEDNGNGGESEGGTSDDQVELPSWKGFLRFIKRIQRNLIKHAGDTLKDKINYLKKLRDNLMLKIEEQFDMIWPSKDQPRRSRRSLLGESKISFPPEIALMSINFLTFAVFLIKITLQVIHLLKEKQYKILGLGVETQPFMEINQRNKQ